MKGLARFVLALENFKHIIYYRRSMSDKFIKEQAEKYFDAICKNKRIQSHIVRGLSSSRNSKQALEKAEYFVSVFRDELVENICACYAQERVFLEKKDQIQEEEIKHEVMERINGELAKMGLEVFVDLE